MRGGFGCTTLLLRVAKFIKFTTLTLFDAICAALTQIWAGLIGRKKEKLIQKISDIIASGYPDDYTLLIPASSS